MRTALYRFFDEQGTTLYIGISLSPVARMAAHMSEANWADEIARSSVTWLETREEALEAERRAIIAEKPMHNKLHNGGTEAEVFACAVGREVMAEALGVGRTAISNAVVANSFPAPWYLVCMELAEETGADFPSGIFAMRRRHEVAP